MELTLGNATRDQFQGTKMFPSHHIVIYWLWMDMTVGGPGKEKEEVFRKQTWNYCPFMLCTTKIIVISVKSP